MGATGPGGGLLLVHAHPDDESIGTGATMARYAAQGARVTLVTCTLGELGEIIPPDLAHLAAGRDDRLGQYRIGELAAACAALGVTDHRFLGGAGRWRDSGMMGLPGNHDPRCFWQADVDEAAARARQRHPRGPPAGHGQLRRQRLLRSPRPHPGAPGGLARLPADWLAGPRSRGTPDVAGGQVLRDGRCRLGPGRGDRADRPGRGGGPPGGLPGGPGRIRTALRNSGRAGDDRDRRHRVPAGQARRDARARDPDRRWTARSTRCPTGSAASVIQATECYTLLAGGPARPRAGPPEADLFAGIAPG